MKKNPATPRYRSSAEKNMKCINNCGIKSKWRSLNQKIAIISVMALTISFLLPLTSVRMTSAQASGFRSGNIPENGISFSFPENWSVHKYSPSDTSRVFEIDSPDLSGRFQVVTIAMKPGTWYDDHCVGIATAYEKWANTYAYDPNFHIVSVQPSGSALNVVGYLTDHGILKSNFLLKFVKTPSSIVIASEDSANSFSGDIWNTLSQIMGTFKITLNNVLDQVGLETCASIAHDSYCGEIFVATQGNVRCRNP